VQFRVPFRIPVLLLCVSLGLLAGSSEALQFQFSGLPFCFAVLLCRVEFPFSLIFQRARHQLTGE